MTHSSLIILLSLVAFIAAAAGYVCFALLRRHRVGDPACGGCGYRVEGLEGLRCPECGSDLRDVGIITAEMTRRLAPRTRRVLAVMLFTILYTLAAVPGAAAVRDLVDPPRWVSTTTKLPALEASAESFFAMDWQDAGDVADRDLEIHVERTRTARSAGTPDYRMVRVATRTTRARSAWFPWVAFGTGCVGWVIGVWLIVRGHRLR